MTRSHERGFAPTATFLAADDFIDLPSGDVMIVNYGLIDDDGVDVMRLASATGKLVWRTHVPALGVTHSGYSQSVYAVARGNALFVISQADGGWFMETAVVGHGRARAALPWSRVDLRRPRPRYRVLGPAAARVAAWTRFVGNACVRASRTFKSRFRVSPPERLQASTMTIAWRAAAKCKPPNVARPSARTWTHVSDGDGMQTE